MDAAVLNQEDPTNKALQVEYQRTSQSGTSFTMGRELDTQLLHEKAEISIKVGLGNNLATSVDIQLVNGPNDNGVGTSWYEPAAYRFGSSFIRFLANGDITISGGKVPDVQWSPNKLYDVRFAFNGEKQIIKVFLYDADELLFESANLWNWHNAKTVTNNTAGNEGTGTHASFFPKLAAVAAVVAVPGNMTEPAIAYFDDLEMVMTPAAVAFTSYSEKIATNEGIIMEYSTFLDADSLSDAAISVTSEDGEQVAVTPSVSEKKLILTPDTALKENTNYTVSVSNVQSVYGDTAPAVTKSVLTDWNFIIDLTINGNAANPTLTAGNNTIAAEIVSTDGIEKPVVLIAALYDKDTNVLLASSAAKGTAAADGTPLSLSTDCDLTQFASHNGVLKVLAWDGFDKMVPYGAAVEFERSK